MDISHLPGILGRYFPELSQIEPLDIVGEGFRSVAVVTAGGVLLRVGKSQEAADGFELEMKVLPVIRRHVKAPVPNPQWRVLPCEDLPFGLLGYRKLPGSNPLPNDEGLKEFFIPELAQFLVELHAVNVDEISAVGAPNVNPMVRQLGAKPVVMPVLTPRLSATDTEVLHNWWDDFERDLSNRKPRNSVCHHDLWYENLLVDSAGHLSGVLDWSHIEVGDPAHDFAAIHHFGTELTELFIAEYRSAGGLLDESDRVRIERYWQARDLGGLAWAIENDDELEIEASNHKILNGPIYDQSNASSANPSSSSDSK